MAEAGLRIFAVRHAKHPTVAIAGVTHASYEAGTSEAVDPGAAGATGRADGLVTHKRLMVTIYGQNLVALLALIGAVAANLVLGTYGPAGALEKKTFKNVIFTECVGALELAAHDGGGQPPTVGVRGVCLWGTNDTYATMLVSASDT